MHLWMLSRSSPFLFTRSLTVPNSIFQTISDLLLLLFTGTRDGVSPGYRPSAPVSWLALNVTERLFVFKPHFPLLTETSKVLCIFAFVLWWCIRSAEAFSCQIPTIFPPPILGRTLFLFRKMPPGCFSFLLPFPCSYPQQPWNLSASMCVWVRGGASLWKNQPTWPGTPWMITIPCLISCPGRRGLSRWGAPEAGMQSPFLACFCWIYKLQLCIPLTPRAALSFQTPSRRSPPLLLVTIMVHICQLLIMC